MNPLQLLRTVRNMRAKAVETMTMGYHCSLFVILALLHLQPLLSWNIWDYSVKWSEDRAKVDNTRIPWESLWSNSLNNIFTPDYIGDPRPPRPRRGHSFHIMKTESGTEYNGHTYIIMFGGRDNDQNAFHVPKTYDVKTVNGTLKFTTYDKKPVNPCNDVDHIYYSIDDQLKYNCNSEPPNKVKIALIYNDVWAYRICNRTVERAFDTACENSGWILLNAGAAQGGCLIQLGVEVCTAPSERYMHGSAMFDDGTLFIYGGFSQRCTDYCDDMWYFDIYMKSWKQAYKAGELTTFHYDTLFGNRKKLYPGFVPVENSTKIQDPLKWFAGPGKRWRHSMAQAPAVTMSLTDVAIVQLAAKYETDVEYVNQQQSVAVFGGHRLWHGFSEENNENNNWGEFSTRPPGGYLDDLWVFTKYLDFTTEPSQTYKQGFGEWTIKTPQESCYSSATEAWETRNYQTCIVVRPTGRAGHSSLFELSSSRKRVWLFGGYTTYYPYLRTDATGAGPGTQSSTGGFIPYPGYDYFRNDLWYYDLDTNLWVEEIPAPGYPVPAPRMDAVLLSLGDEFFFLHGGFGDNTVYGDTWYYEIAKKRWLQKKVFVRPLYPDSCTDDLEYLQDHQDCFKLSWPKHLQRDQYYPFDIVPYGSGQTHYWPDYQHGPYYGLFPINTSGSQLDALSYGEVVPVGTPIAPFAATGVMQAARNFTYMMNASHNATIWERCTSVFGEPTRGHKLDGLFGRSNSSIMIAQPRRRRPGWDGCRDRTDSRRDLPPELQWLQPLPRYAHRGVFYAPTNEIFIYGGLAYLREEPQTYSDTYAVSTLNDMWYYHLNHCPNNCTLQGDCKLGFCSCHVGFYGVDCSNTSCPGTFCYNDEYSKEQICTHACQAGYTHTDNDTYVEDIYKLPCSRNHPGESNGICNGFGSVQCAPPFVGDDCSTKDCKSNCSFNGWCSIEYPVSRCLCVPGYFGEICENKVCLNNCTYPNGLCNSTTGVCDCNLMYSPYNNSRVFKRWGGEDCSFLFAYSAAHPTAWLQMLQWRGWVLATLLLLTVHWLIDLPFGYS